MKLTQARYKCMHIDADIKLNINELIAFCFYAPFAAVNGVKR